MAARIGAGAAPRASVQQKLGAFLKTLPEYPCQQGSRLNAAGINYDSLKAMQAMKRSQQLESLAPPTDDGTNWQIRFQDKDG